MIDKILENTFNPLNSKINDYFEYNTDFFSF
jgi:hypothetical protein